MIPSLLDNTQHAIHRLSIPMCCIKIDTLLIIRSKLQYEQKYKVERLDMWSLRRSLKKG
jgi:hypothetical protein